MSLLDKKQVSDTAKRYQASRDDLSYKQLAAASWFSTHEAQLINIGRALLFVFAVGLFGYGFVTWVAYGAIGVTRDNQNAVAQVQSFQNYREMQRAYSADPLVFQPVEVLSAVDDTYTFITRVRNPNPTWMVEVVYRYSGTFGATAVARTVLMPGQQGVLTAYDVVGQNGVRDVQIDVLQLQWKRLNPHTMQDTEEYVYSRLSFPISNLSIEPGNQTEERPSIISFTLTNDTAFSFVSVPYTVLMYAGNQIVDARPLIIDRFRSGETETVAFNYGYAMLPTTDVVVVPALNVLDPAVYLGVSE